MIVPAASTTRIAGALELPRTGNAAIAKPPPGRAATLAGYPSEADVAGPPSPSIARRPLPATVRMIPCGSTRRIRLAIESAIRTAPSASTARLPAHRRRAAVAGPPSPDVPRRSGVPASTVAGTPGATRKTAAGSGAAGACETMWA